jgi:rubrerythrin
MFSILPIPIDAITQGDADKEMLRTAIMAELDAINLYEQMAARTRNTGLRKILLDVAREEKTHVGEFQALLLQVDPEQAQELREGYEEVKEKGDSGSRAAA